MTKGKKKEVREAAADTCLKCPCASSSLEGSRSCDGSRPASSLCSCCSLMLLALSTQTQQPRVSSRSRSGWTPSCARQRTRRRLFFWLQTGGVHRVERVGGVNKADEVTQRRSKSHFCLKKRLLSAKHSCAAARCLFLNGGQCRHSAGRRLAKG